MKTVSLIQAKSKLSQLIGQALNGQQIVVGRGKRRVVLMPFDVALAHAEFNAAFPPAAVEPRDAISRIHRVIRRVRQAA